MKKLFFVASALAALSLLAPSIGFAQRADNQFGLYSEAAAGAGTQNIAADTGTPFFAYLVLTVPVDNDMNEVTSIEAFEFMVTFSNGAMVFKLSETLPPGAINVGDATSPALGLDYTVGLATPIQVTGGNVTVVSFQFMVQTADPIEIFIVNSRNGEMQFQEASGKTLVQAYPASSDQNLPAASFNGTVTATESETWGGVKALYR